MASRLDLVKGRLSRECVCCCLNRCPEVFCHLKAVAVTYGRAIHCLAVSFFQRVFWLVWIDNCRKTENLRPRESEAFFFTANSSKWLFQGWFIPSVPCEGAFWEELALYAVSSENQNKAEWTFWYSAFLRSSPPPPTAMFSTQAVHRMWKYAYLHWYC